VFVCHFVCWYDCGFLSGGKRWSEILHARSTTIRTGLLPFWLAGSHGGVVGSSYIEIAVGHSELSAAALLKAVWWDLHLASLLMHFIVSFRLNLHSFDSLGWVSGRAPGL